MSSKASYDLRGGFVDFDMDLTNAHGGVNNNLYITFPHKPNCGSSCYCDSGPAGGCSELDFIENNGNCFAQTTFHTDPWGNEKGGHNIGTGGIGPHVHVHASWSADGNSLTVDINGRKTSGEGLGEQLAQWGAVLYSSQWTGWVPGSCSGDGNLDGSSFSVSNMKIHGLVKQGPEPALCEPGPKPSPSPPGPSPPAPLPPPGPSPSCKTPVECHGALARKGNRIVDKHGSNVQLKGMSMFWSNWAGAFWNGQVVKYLAADWHIGIIRCAMGVVTNGAPVDGGYLSDPEGNKAKVSAVVDAAIEAGIYVLIDWHVEGRCDAGQAAPFFSQMAQKYGHLPNIIWETCNEPKEWPWNSGLKAYHEQVIPSIREHSSNLIVCGTNTWSQDVDDASRNQLADPNVAYTLHFYSSMHKQGNRDKASTAMSNGAAIFVTEWGTEQDGEGNFDETNRWLDFLKQNSISCANWGVYDKDSEAWAIVSQGSPPTGGWTDGQLSNSGRFVRAYIRGDAPSPGPSPGCQCDCWWASPASCGRSDGSCCYNKCCHGLSLAPSPAPGVGGNWTETVALLV